jgi:hypothetical protein
MAKQDGKDGTYYFPTTERGAVPLSYHEMVRVIMHNIIVNGECNVNRVFDQH